MKHQIAIEILPFSEAPWAPGQGVDGLRWAWRASSPNGNVVTGAHAGKKKDAVEVAKRAADRLRESAKASGKGESWREFRMPGSPLPERDYG